MEAVGPFQLGVDRNGVKPKKWSDLSAGGKVLRGTARTSNLTVILVGGAFSCILAYALATELFAKNSPTKLYDDACERIKKSEAVSCFPGTYLYTCQPPLVIRNGRRGVGLDSIYPPPPLRDTFRSFEEIWGSDVIGSDKGGFLGFLSPIFPQRCHASRT